MPEQLHNQRIPDVVQQAFDVVLAFQLPNSDNTEFRDRISIYTKQESLCTSTLLLNNEGLTNGMLSACVDSIRAYLDNFDIQKNRFNTAIHSYLKKIEAFNDIDRQIAEKQRQLEQTEIRVEEKHTANQHYAQAKDTRHKLEEAYEKIYRAQGQRQAKDFSQPLYALILIIIGLSELMINYQSFVDFFNIPAMGIASACLVAGVVATNSHYHGTRLKARGYYFDDYVELGERKKEIWVITIASIFLVAAIIFVGGVRYLWAMDVVRQLDSGNFSITDPTNNLPSINVSQKVILSLLANLFVWFVGAALAYAVHDKNPAFTEKLREFKKANEHYLVLRKTVDSEIHRLRALLEKDIEELKNTALSIEQEVRPLAEMLATMKDKVNNINAEADRLVNKLIQNYREILCSIAAVDNRTLNFNYRGEIINLASYQQLAINYRLQTTLE